jgi:parvulin-like peptidyl-prolyl isomerase
MAKKEIQSSRGPTRRQVALSRKEREQLRIFYLGLGVVGALIIIVLAVGLTQTYIIEPNAPVAIVNGKEIITKAYHRQVQYERFLLQQQLNQLLQQQASLPEDNDDQFSQFLRNQYQQLTNQLLQQLSIVDRQALDNMIADELIADETAKRNITVSEEEITEFINRSLANQAGGLTEAAASETSTARVEASATAAAWTPTPTFTPSPTLTVTETMTEPTATPANTATPAPTPTLNIIGAETLAGQYRQWLDTLAQEVDIDEAEYRQFIRKTILQDKLRAAIGDETPRFAEQVRARHILVETEEAAKEVIERLEAGEDFADLAAELSQDTSSATNGGDLGFAPRGRYVAPVEEAVFTLPIGQISEPIETQFGWHVVEVLEREKERELSPADYSRSQRTAYDTWLNNALNSAEIEDLWSADKAPPNPF